MAIKVHVTYAQLQNINGLLGINKKMYYVDKIPINRFEIRLNPADSEFVFIFKGTQADRRANFLLDFGLTTAEQVEYFED